MRLSCCWPRATTAAAALPYAPLRTRNSTSPHRTASCVTPTHLTAAARPAARQMLEWANTYGGIFKFSLGFQPVVVVSDPAVAVQVLGRAPGRAIPRKCVGYKFFDLVSAGRRCACRRVEEGPGPGQVSTGVVGKGRAGVSPCASLWPGLGRSRIWAGRMCAFRVSATIAATDAMAPALLPCPCRPQATNASGAHSFFTTSDEGQWAAVRKAAAAAFSSANVK